MAISTSTTEKRATLDDLMRTEGKAELIRGRIVPLMATGYRPNLIAAEVFVSLRNYAKATGRGVAFTESVGFAVRELASGRESFSPDAAYYDGPPPANDMDFVSGPPTLAVEVRSKSDYGPAAEAEMAAKRADYFEAGTAVVWDVDPREECVRSYRGDAPEQSLRFAKGQIAAAEPAVPGWRLAVDDLFS